MKYFFLSINIFILFSFKAVAGFDDYFENKTLRIDYYHSGNDTTEYYTMDELRQEPLWGGSKVNLIDTFNFGSYKFIAYDKASGKIIFQHSERDEKICLDLKFILSGENKAIVEIQPIENKKGYCHYFLDCSAKEIAKEVISHFFG